MFPEKYFLLHVYLSVNEEIQLDDTFDVDLHLPM